MCTKCKKRNKKGRVGAVSDWDINELAVMGAGGLISKALVNPLSKAIWKNSKPKYTPLIIKAGLAFAMSMIEDKTAQTAAKGAAVATLLEAGDILLPKVFDPTGFYMPQDAATSGVGAVELVWQGEILEQGDTIAGAEDVL